MFSSSSKETNLLEKQQMGELSSKSTAEAKNNNNDDNFQPMVQSGNKINETDVLSNHSSEQSSNSGKVAAYWSCLSPRTKGIIFINLFCLFQLCFNVGSKIVLSKGVNVFDFIFIRTFINFAGSFIVAKSMGKRIFADVPRDQRCNLAIRSVAGMLGFSLIMYSIQILPLFVYMIVFSTYMFWTSLLGYLILREQVDRITMAGIVFCFIGVALIASAEEESVTSTETESSSSTAVEYTRMQTVIALILTFSVSWLVALINIMNRSMKNVHFSLINVNYGLLGSLIFALIIVGECIYKQQWFRIYTAEMYGYIFLCSLFNYGLQTCGTLAYQSDKSAYISLIAQVGTVYNLLADILIFNQTFVSQEFIGASIIIAFTIAVIVMKK